MQLKNPKNQKALGQIDMTKKYIVETLTTFRHVHVVEADNEDQAFAIASEADDNWQEFLGVQRFDVSEYTEERIKHFKVKDYFWNGSAFLNEEGNIAYRHPQNFEIHPNETKII